MNWGKRSKVLILPAFSQFSCMCFSIESDRGWWVTTVRNTEMCWLALPSWTSSPRWFGTSQMPWEILGVGATTLSCRCILGCQLCHHPISNIWSPCDLHLIQLIWVPSTWGVIEHAIQMGWKVFFHLVWIWSYTKRLFGPRCPGRAQTLCYGEERSLAWSHEQIPDQGGWSEVVEFFITKMATLDWERSQSFVLAVLLKKWYVWWMKSG